MSVLEANNVYNIHENKEDPLNSFMKLTMVDP